MRKEGGSGQIESEGGRDSTCVGESQDSRGLLPLQPECVGDGYRFIDQSIQVTLHTIRPAPEPVWWKGVGKGGKNKRRGNEGDLLD